MSNPRKKTKFGIREAILLSFVVFTSIALGGIAATTGIFAGIIGGVTSETTSAALKNQVQQDMQNKTSSYAITIESQLEQASRDLDGMAVAISSVLDSPFEFGYRKSYYHVDILPKDTRLFDGTYLSKDTYYPSNIPPDIKFDQESELNVSANYSHYLIYPDSYAAMGNNEYNLTGIHGTYVNRTAHLDPIMADLLKKNPHYSWIYMDFEIGVQRTFPWTGSDTTVFGTRTESPYDYKTSDWYKDAKSAAGKVVWTAPYLDPYIGWIVTISKAVYNHSAFVGVVGIDFTLNQISNTVANISYFDSGYGFLLDQEGQVIAHPEVEFDPDEEEAPAITDYEPISASLLATMTQNNTGFTQVRKAGRAYYLSYTPVTISNYTLGIMVPTSEVLKPVEVLQDKINQNLGIQLAIIFSVLGGILVASLYIGLKTADSVVKPIHKLTQIALQLSTEDVGKTAAEKIDEDFGKELLEQDDEIGGLTRSFKNLVMMVREDASGKNAQNKQDNAE